MCDFTRAPAQLSLPGAASGSLGPFKQEQARTLAYLFLSLGKEKKDNPFSLLEQFIIAHFLGIFFNYLYFRKMDNDR